VTIDDGGDGAAAARKVHCGVDGRAHPCTATDDPLTAAPVILETTAVVDAADDIIGT
jgi:hypothetical protein